MADDNEDLEILLDEAEGEKKDSAEDLVIESAEDKPGAAASGDKDEPEKKVVEPEEGVERLRESLAQERLARQEAERRSAAAHAEAQSARSEAQDSNLALVKNAVEAVKSQQESLKVRYRQARADGDIDAEADILAEMQTNAAKLVQLEQGHAVLEAQAKEPKPEPRQAPADPVEALAAQLSPRSAAWVRAHPQCATDQRQFQKMLAAHNLAVADGLQVDTDDYFAAIEGTMGLNRRSAELDVDDATSQAAKPAQRRQSPPAAPVSRGGPAGSNPNRVTLTAAEREVASMMFPEEKDPYRAYAANKLALQREGKMSTH